jgi:hypothetical protein
VEKRVEIIAVKVLIEVVITIAQNETCKTENPGDFCQIDLQEMHLAVCFEEAEIEWWVLCSKMT